VKHLNLIDNLHFTTSNVVVISPQIFCSAAFTEMVKATLAWLLLYKSLLCCAAELVEVADDVQ
jgi:hypothetical protein